MERWITWKGRHLLVDSNGKIVNNKKERYKNAKKINELEYNVMSEEFAESLTEEEKELIRSYGTGGRYSYHLNDPEMLNFERTFRYFDENGKLKEEKVALKDIFNKNFDRKAIYTKTSDRNKDENIIFNYERTQDIIKSVNSMDKIFDKKGITLDKDVILYRKGFESLEDIQNGYVRKGYTSTSIVSRINKKTPGGLKLGENEFEILVPAGTKILPIKDLVPDDIKYQKEVVLPRNIKYTLIEDKSTGGWNKEKLQFEKNKNKYIVEASRG